MSGLLLVTPLRTEALCARLGAPGTEVWRTGMGRWRSLRAAAGVVGAAGGGAGGSGSVPVGQVDRERPGFVVVLGLAGGLQAGQRAGEVVVADTLALAPLQELVPVAAAGAVTEALTAAGVPAASGTVVSTTRLALSPAARAAAAAGGAVAVDMESWWLAGAGGPVPPRLAVVRVLSDAPGQELVSVRTPPALVRAFRALVRVARALRAEAAALTPRPTEVPS